MSEATQYRELQLFSGRHKKFLVGPRQNVGPAGRGPAGPQDPMGHAAILDGVTSCICINQLTRESPPRLLAGKYHAVIKRSFLLFTMYSRLKVAAACNNCRRRKTKCDAQSPSAFLLCSYHFPSTCLTLEYLVCQPCRNRGEIACTYGRDPAGDQRRLSKTQNRPNSSRMAGTPPRHKSVPASSGTNHSNHLVGDSILTEKWN